MIAAPLLESICCKPILCNIAPNAKRKAAKSDSKMGNKFSNTNGAQFSKGGLNFNNKF